MNILIRKTLVSIVLLLVVGFGLKYIINNNNQPITSNDITNLITVEIIANNETSSFIITTQHKTLKDALSDAFEIDGKETEMGFFLESVNQIKADSAKQEWWNITKSGQPINKSIDKTYISGGDKYELTLKVGY